MGCTFCATGQMGFARDLSETEIFEQAVRFATELRMRGERPFVFSNLKENLGLSEIAEFIVRAGGLAVADSA